MILTMTTSELYNSYREQMRRVADIKFSSALLQWDQETYLPVKAAAIRGQQIATLSELAHQLFTDEKLGSVLNELKQREGLAENDKKNVDLTFEDYTKNKKYGILLTSQAAYLTSKKYLEDLVTMLQGWERASLMINETMLSHRIKDFSASFPLIISINSGALILFTPIMYST